MSGGSLLTLLKERIGDSALLAYIGALRATVRVQRVGEAMLDRLHQRGHPVILACWKSHWLATAWLLERQGIFTPTAPGRLGRMNAKLLTRLGWRVVPGSYRWESILELCRCLETGHDVALVPDGPHGPPRQVQPGAFYLAERSGCPIVPFAVAASPQCPAGNNEGTVYPVPLGRAAIYFGAPVWIEKGRKADAYRQKKEELERVLCDAEAAARMALEW